MSRVVGFGVLGHVPSLPNPQASELVGLGSGGSGASVGLGFRISGLLLVKIF